MKKVLVILALVAVTGIASAELLNNPETFETQALGSVGNGNPALNWESWGQGSGDMGYSDTWWPGDDDGSQPGLQTTPSVVDSGTSYGQALLVDMNPNHNWWSYNIAFAHGNEIASLSGSGNRVQLNYDVILTQGQTIGQDGRTPTNVGIMKLEFFDDLARTNLVGVVAADPFELIDADGTWINISFGGDFAIPAGANYVTPVLGLTGGGAIALFDNVSLTTVVPEPATMALLGLGGLLLRRKK